jgi:multidrug efflux pump subunit AcrA (membrane-fusion protein)
LLEEGATVRNWQSILSIFDDHTGILVSTSVPGKVIERVNPGLPARVTLDEFPDVILPGVVFEVMPLPNPGVGMVPGVRYTTRVKIEEGFPGIRPEMRARVEILLDGLDDVLGVPVQAVLHSDGQDWVALKNADGVFAWREVTVGVPSEAFVEVVDGLQGGDLVALDPTALANRERPGRIRNEARVNPQKRPSRKVL